MRTPFSHQLGHRCGPRRRLDVPSSSGGGSSTITTTPPLLALPAEILSLVLAALPPVELARTMAVCRGLREPAADTKLWLPHCRAQWPQDDFSDCAAGPGRFGARHRLFARLVVCSTGVDRVRDDIRRAVLLMGGQWQSDLTHDVTHLLCGAMWTAKARSSRARRRHCVTVDWLWASIRAARLQRETDHRPGIMHGVRLATSTLGPQLTPKVQFLLESSGGKYHRELRNPLSADATRPATTHLVVFQLPGNPLPSSASAKIAAAKRWGVPVVSYRWLTDSVYSQRCLDPQVYAVPVSVGADNLEPA